MVCYARPASRFAAFLLVALIVFGRPVGHYLGTAAILVAALAAAGGAAIVAAFVLAAFASTRRQRAAAGGCVSCQFRCQHAMTGPSRRPWLVTTANRQEPGPSHPVRTPPAGHAGPVPLPMPSIRPAGLAAAAGPAGAGTAPHWPDRPLRRTPGQPEPVRSPA